MVEKEMENFILVLVLIFSFVLLPHFFDLRYVCLCKSCYILTSPKHTPSVPELFDFDGENANEDNHAAG